jgi:peptidoglycan L-alanyl-D-glutamate endopeptidase CwlK
MLATILYVQFAKSKRRLSVFKLSKKSIERLVGVHPDLVAVVQRAIEISKVDFTVICGVRTFQEQTDLYAKGRTKPGPVVTWTLNSQHLKQKTGYSHAVDLAAWVNGKISWEWPHYINIEDAMNSTAQELGIKIKWGGDFTRPDGPHFELLQSEYLK